jgi:hypothetical protein
MVTSAPAEEDVELGVDVGLGGGDGESVESFLMVAGRRTRGVDGGVVVAESSKKKSSGEMSRCAGEGSSAGRIDAFVGGGQAAVHGPPFVTWMVVAGEQRGLHPDLEVLGMPWAHPQASIPTRNEVIV